MVIVRPLVGLSVLLARFDQVGLPARAPAPAPGVVRSSEAMGKQGVLHG